MYSPIRSKDVSMSFDPASPGPHQHPYGPPDFRDPYAPAAPRSSSAKWLWLLLGGGLLMTLLCCGGGLGVVMFGLNIITAEIKDQIRDIPKFREHIGEVSEFEMDVSGSFAAQSEDENTYRYKVRGSKGSGELTVIHHTDDNGDEVIDQAMLRLDDGNTVQIVP
jgi:hypothetical protein